MRISAVEAFGVDEQVVDLWQETGVSELLPVQESALREHGALDGRDLLVFSPTSSGKTFVGEMAAVKTARLGKRVLYLVPQKALAEEKHRDLKEKYAPLGVRTVISTRDRREHDEAINEGHFHIAVVVFEKMQGLLVSNPALLRGVGLVIVDELQMLGDQLRGPGLEILLTKLKLPGADGSRPQVIGLSAVLGNSDSLAAWMGAELCTTARRPVELRKGVLLGGEFHYLEHNSGAVGHEKLEQVRPDASPEQVLVNQVRSFAKAGEQSLVFCQTKRDCIETAIAIARGLPGIESPEAAREVAGLEESRGRDILVCLLERGVAYHNADLDADQRALIESQFRRGGIRVLCATTTLAMGMNLPAKNVFVDPERWDQDRTGHWTRVPIKQAEYENMSGRAGRLGLTEDFGRAILVAESQFDARTLWDCFVRGPLGAIAPALGNDPLAHHALNLVASGVCHTSDELREVLLGSYTGQTHWCGESKEPAFDRDLHSALALCISGQLISKDDLDEELRKWLKHGHEFKSADEALEAARDKLHEALSAHSVSLDMIE